MHEILNMKDFLETTKALVYQEAEDTKLPIKLHIDLSLEKGKELAEKLGANIEIVEAGILLMDCLIGKAAQQNKIDEHIQISLEKANELLENSNLDENAKENIRHCILEHHGVENFYSIESEICCNADCYRFVSIKGFTMAIRYLREMPFEGLINLVENKFNEKNGLLTLDICKEELQDQIETIKKYIEFLKK